MSWPSSFLCIRCIHSAPDFSEQISPFFINPFLFCYSPFVSSFLFENSDVVRFLISMQTLTRENKKEAKVQKGKKEKVVGSVGLANLYVSPSSGPSGHTIV
jgi:hypothetical protein